MTVVGIDVGGTKIEAILFDKKVLKSIRIDTQADKDYKAVLSNIASAAKQVMDDKVTDIGIGLPGYIYEGKLYGCPNTPSLEGKGIIKDLSKLLGKRVVVENDAKLFTLAETRMGAGKGKSNVIGLIIGTGVGAGIIANGSLVRGSLGSAGEVGHMPHLNHDYEHYCSGHGLSRMHKEKTGENKGASAILKSSPALEEYYDCLGRLVASLIDAFNPDTIVVGGGVSRSLDFKRLTKITKKYALNMPFNHAKIVSSKISDSAGSIGAALLAIESIK